MTSQTVLIVDDNEADRYILKRLMQRGTPYGSVLEAIDGVEALGLLSELEQAPDLILLDVNMPRMDGFEFLERYEAECTAQKVECASIYLMISDQDPGGHRLDAQRFRSVRGFVTKLPSDGAELVEQIERGLDG